MASSSAFPFLQLPYDLREELYKLTIIQSIKTGSTSKPKGFLTWPRTPTSASSLALKTSSKGWQVHDFKLANNLPLVNRQTWTEFQEFLLKQVRHLKLRQDFQWGVRPTQATLRYLVDAVSMHSSVRTVHIGLTIPMDHKAPKTFWETPESWISHPRLLAEVVRAHHLLGAAYDNMLRDHGAQILGRYYYALSPRQLLTPDPRVPGGENWVMDSSFVLRNTLGDLARILEGFPLLKRIDIKPDALNLLMFWPDPLETMKGFAPLHEKGVEVLLILRTVPRWIFLMMMHQTGFDIRRLTLCCPDGSAMPDKDMFFFSSATNHEPVVCHFFNNLFILPGSGLSPFSD